MDTDLRILIVDHTSDAERCEHELRTAGFEFQSQRVCTRESLAAALDGFSPHLILSELDLPTDLDGMSALRIARARSPDIPFIFISGTIGEERAVAAVKAGAAACLLKDKLHRLGLVVERALLEARERRNNEVRVLRDLATEFAAALASLGQDSIDGSEMCWPDSEERPLEGMQRRARQVPCAPASSSKPAPRAAARPDTTSKH